MTKKEKSEFVSNTLEDIYGTPEIPLNHKDNYTLLIAVLLSAQCTDVKVNQISPSLFERADNPFDMSKMRLAEVEKIIRPIGLYKNKSKAIINLSEILVEDFDGEVPNTFEELESLPGVGHKTASVVMSQGFGVPAFPVDTHIHRLMYRWGLSNGKNVVQTENDAKKLFPKNLWNKLHLQIILYGREFSPARGWDIKNDIITQKVGRKSLINNFNQ